MYGLTRPRPLQSPTAEGKQENVIQFDSLEKPSRNLGTTHTQYDRLWCLWFLVDIGIGFLPSPISTKCIGSDRHNVHKWMPINDSSALVLYVVKTVDTIEY